MLLLRSAPELNMETQTLCSQSSQFKNENKSVESKNESTNYLHKYLKIIVFFFYWIFLMIIMTGFSIKPQFLIFQNILLSTIVL